MTAVALTLVATIVLLTLAFVAALDRQRRAHERREMLLANQLLHAAGKTWTPPPAAVEKEPPPERKPYLASPEQHPFDP